MWIDPISFRSLKKTDLAMLLVSLIKLADPTSRPAAHQVRKYASSLAYFRSFHVDSVRRAGHWSSATSFATRYLIPHLRDTQCVAMGCPPVSTRDLITFMLCLFIIVPMSTYISYALLVLSIDVVICLYTSFIYILSIYIDIYGYLYTYFICTVCISIICPNIYAY